MSRSGDVTTLQRVLAAEHAAIYAYGVIGANVDADERPVARVGDTAHRVRRDQLRALLGERSVRPAAAAAGYRLPFTVATPAEAARLAVLVEERVAGVWIDAVETLRDDLRSLAAHAVQDAAARAAVWRNGSVALPGLRPNEVP